MVMKNILDDYIYPDMANAILKRDGVLKVVNSVVNNNIVDEKSICADTDIEKLVDLMIERIEEKRTALGI